MKFIKSHENASDGEHIVRARRELDTAAQTLAASLSACRHYVVPDSSKKGVFQIDPRFLLFEFSHGILLRKSQVTLVRKLIQNIRDGKSVCHQMIMGAGKTTVVGPLLAMLLASSKHLIVEVVPSALLDFSANVLRERFSSAVRKPVFTFTFDRYEEVTLELYNKLLTARYLRAVVVATPSAVKSFMLKFLEICHNLNRQKNIAAEQSLKRRSSISKVSIATMLGLFRKPALSAGELTLDDMNNLKRQAAHCEKIFSLFESSIEIMDEVDILLHPLKSELNWPMGLKDPLDFTITAVGNGLRWQIPSHLLDAIFHCCGFPILAEIAESKQATEVLDQLSEVIDTGFSLLHIQKSPHFALISKKYYFDKIEPLLAKWLLLWLRARKLPKMTDHQILSFLAKGSQCASDIIDLIKTLNDEHAKMLNLGHDWLKSYLPFVLGKINRVHFGLLQPDDVQLLEDDGVKIPTTRKLLAVPFVAKDVPSRASEFAHPDILIGLSILAYRYEGLRKKDFFLVMRHLRESLDEQSGPFKNRPSCMLFEEWILNTGKIIRGSKKRKSMVTRGNVRQGSTRMSGIFKRGRVLTLFNDVFSEDDETIWPLHLVDPQDREQFRILYPLLKRLPHVVMYYLNELIFPEALQHQGLKLATCGQELGGNILFGRRIGFSGTPSDILPQELGSCQYEKGSDGRVVHYLTLPSITEPVKLYGSWTALTILDHIASADPPYRALIDTGALITGLSNKTVAEYLLKKGLKGLQGVVYLDEFDRQMILLREGMKVMKLVDCSLAWGDRFTFYDQVHTTGMDIKQAADACALLTLGKDMVFRDYAQGAFRMRGIGKGQTIKLLVVPEIEERIKVEVSIGSGVNVNERPPREGKEYLQDVISWLNINSMRVDSIQFNLLCEQSCGNIWRKRAFANLKANHRTLHEANCSPALIRCMAVFRERVDFTIENAVPTSTRYSQKIYDTIEMNR